MRKLLYMMSLVPLMWACDNYSYDAVDNTLGGIDLTDLHFDAAGGNTTLTVTAESGEVRASSDAPWCTTTVSGNEITVTAADNYADQMGRVAVLTVTRGGKSAKIPVNQRGHHFEVESLSMNVSFLTGSHSVGFESVNPVTATSEAEWITDITVAGNNTVNFNVTRNPAGADPRTGRIKLTQNGYNRYVDVTQGEGMLLYEDYLGTYKMHFASNGYFETGWTRDKYITVTFEQKEYGKTYYIRGMLSDDWEPWADIVANYSEAGPVFLSQVIYIYTDGTVIWCMTQVYYGSSGWWLGNGENCGFKPSNLVFDAATGDLSFEWIDNGGFGYDGYDQRGIIYYTSTSQWVAAGTASADYGQLYRPRLEKVVAE